MGADKVVLSRCMFAWNFFLLGCWFYITWTMSYVSYGREWHYKTFHTGSYSGRVFHGEQKPTLRTVALNRLLNFTRYYSLYKRTRGKERSFHQEIWWSSLDPGHCTKVNTISGESATLILCVCFGYFYSWKSISPVGGFQIVFLSNGDIFVNQ